MAAAVIPAHSGATRAQHTSTPIRHLIVLLQENISFDHYFGTAGQWPYRGAAHAQSQRIQPGAADPGPGLHLPIVNPSAGPATDALNGAGVCGHGTPLAGHQDRCGYGPRLPFLLISPYARRNYVDSALTDQTSVLRFIEDNWLRGGRIGHGSFDTLAGSLDGMFTWRKPHFAPLILNPWTGEPRR